MRFVLDEDVDVAVRTFLEQKFHEAWTAPQAALAGGDDDDLGIYAQDQRAVLVTHDREMTERRKQKTFGPHVWLHCHQLHAVDALTTAFDNFAPLLTTDCVIEVQLDGTFVFHPARWP